MIEKSSKNKCTVLVNSCDGYDDLWYPFFELFKKFWANCPYEIVLNTESKMYENPDLDIRCCNCQSKNLPYGKRLKNCLKTIKTPYVILMLDDFFLRKPVNQNFLDKIISYLDNNLDVACFNFDIQHDRYDIDDGRFPEFYRRSQFGEYKYNMQVGIWRTQELYHAWKDKESPWQWELYGNVRSWKPDTSIYVLKPGAATPLDYGYYPAPRGVYRKKWVVEDVDPLFAEHGILIDYNVRGIYQGDAGEQDELNFIQIAHQQLYSYGIMGYLKYLIWYIKRKFLQIIGKDRSLLIYADDLNRSKYEKDDN